MRKHAPSMLLPVQTSFMHTACSACHLTNIEFQKWNSTCRLRQGYENSVSFWEWYVHWKFLVHPGKNPNLCLWGSSEESFSTAKSWMKLMPVSIMCSQCCATMTTTAICTQKWAGAELRSCGSFMYIFCSSALIVQWWCVGMAWLSVFGLRYLWCLKEAMITHAKCGTYARNIACTQSLHTHL